MGTLADSTPAMMLEDYLRANGLDLNGWSLFIGKMPDKPDQAVALNDTGGREGFPHLLVDNPSIQVMVRGGRGGNGYQVSYLKIREVRDYILGIMDAPPEFPELVSITERGHITPMGQDDTDRQLWSCNFQLIVEPQANGITHRTSL